MKAIKVGFGVLAVAIFISWFSFGTAYAQIGYDVWVDRWFKVNTNFKGYEHNPAGPPDWFTVNARFTMYVHITAWVDPNFTADFWYYSDDIANWQQVTPITLNFLNGSPLDFLIWVENNGTGLPQGDIDRLAFAARISGKLARTTPTLQTASFKCLGGYYIEKDTSEPLDPIYQLSGVTMTGTLIPLNFCDSARNLQYPPCLPPQPN
jgi:hypothetical protein